MGKKHNAPKFRRAKKAHPILILLLIVLALPPLGLGAFLYTFDVNSYREHIERAIQERTGREIQLAGKISWRFSAEHGISLGIKNVVIKNPSWASRPDMARVGEAKLRLNVWPLLDKKLDVIAFELSKTELQLESGKNGETNWAFSPKTSTKDSSVNDSSTPEPAAQNEPVTLHVQEIKITNSRVGFKNKDGSLSLFDLPELALTNGASGLNAHYQGSLAGIPTEIDLAGGKYDQISGASWPFNLVVHYGTKELEARGSLQDGIKKIAFDKFVLSSGESKLAGTVTMFLGKNRPSIEGNITSEQLDLADLSFDDALTSEQKTTATQAADGKKPVDSSIKIFSRKPLAFNALKAVDARIGVAVQSLVFGLTTIQQVQTQLVLENGRLTLSPLKGRVAGGETEANIKIDASAFPAQLSASFKAPALDLSQLFNLGGIESAISGKTDVDIALTAVGNSPHELAAHTNGKIDLLMNKGTVSSSKLADIAGILIQLFAPGMSGLTNTGINCMAARYVITDGLMDTKGLIIDTEMTTISGKGYINLPDERIGMSLFTRPKGIGIGSMIPPMQVAGALSNPSFSFDTAGAVQKLTGLLLQNGSAADGVPNLVTIEGKNTCAATLDNPHAPRPTNTAPLVPSSLTDISGLSDSLPDQIKEFGETLLKGFLAE